ncbi:MAG: UDP-N-acetylmuramate--L-alanine ligase [Candidatus Krumholzibacteriota bacterium]|nr:UDP-N-acetylmuramate--L-alanine ligase [Candidatus Krumholzibacteriota bacterium]
MLGSARHIHFVGIGGIGMSGIAEVLLNLDFIVSGSDLQLSQVTDHLESVGATIYEGHSGENIKDADIVVVSSAVPSGNPEIVAAKENQIPLIPRSDMLGELMKIRTGIAIAGAHGKTTTTSLAAVVLQEAGLDPTVVVGGKLKSLNTNAKLGTGDFLVAEVDESDGNFVRLSPAIALITNIDAEHLDFYGSLDRICDAFVSFARQVPFIGTVICCIDDPQIRGILPRIDRTIITYGFGSDADIRGEILDYQSDGTRFRVFTGDVETGEIFIKLPGSHNVLNALGVVALAHVLDIDFRHMKKALSGFKGVGRRFETKGTAAGVLVIDDYGHHPTEVKAAVETARRSFDRRVVVVFQPHRFTRTRDLHNRFEGVFQAADEVFVTSVYPAGEHPIPGVEGELVYRSALKGGVKKITYYPEWDDLRKAVFESMGEGDLLLTLGAGDIFRLGEEFLREKEEN